MPSKFPRKHHYVPVVYLKQFVDEDLRLYVFDKNTGDVRKQLPKKIMHRRDYYRQPHAPKDKGEYCLELMLDRVFESRIMKLTNKLVNRCNDMTEMDFIRFMQYMELQYLRVPKQCDAAKAMAKQQIESVALSNPKIANGLLNNHYKIEIKDHFRFNFMHEMTKSRMFFRYFARMNWIVWSAPEGFTFLTTDNPVVMFNPDYPELEHSGIGRAGTVLFFPLSPNHCLELMHPEKKNDESFDPAAIIEAEDLKDGGVSISYRDKLPSESVTAMNYIIADRSDRFVVSGDQQVIDVVKNDFRGLSDGVQGHDE